MRLESAWYARRQPAVVEPIMCEAFWEWRWIPPLWSHVRAIPSAVYAAFHSQGERRGSGVVAPFEVSGLSLFLDCSVFGLTPCEVRVLVLTGERRHVMPSTPVPPVPSHGVAPSTSPRSAPKWLVRTKGHYLRGAWAYQRISRHTDHGPTGVQRRWPARLFRPRGLLTVEGTGLNATGIDRGPGRIVKT